MNPRFEIVRTDAGWHTRFVAANGETVMTSEVYTREEDARHAATLVATNYRIETTEIDERVMTL